MMQGDAEFRSKPEDLQVWTVRNAQNQMVPFSNFATTRWEGGPDVVNRFQGYTALQMEANAGGAYQFRSSHERYSDLD